MANNGEAPQGTVKDRVLKCEVRCMRLCWLTVSVCAEAACRSLYVAALTFPAWCEEKTRRSGGEG